MSFQQRTMKSLHYDPSGACLEMIRQVSRVRRKRRESLDKEPDRRTFVDHQNCSPPNSLNSLAEFRCKSAIATANKSKFGRVNSAGRVNKPNDSLDRLRINYWAKSVGRSASKTHGRPDALNKINERSRSNRAPRNFAAPTGSSVTAVTYRRFRGRKLSAEGW